MNIPKIDENRIPISPISQKNRPKKYKKSRYSASDFGRELGRRGGRIGGVARARSLSPERRREIAKSGALARWGSIEEPLHHVIKIENGIEIPKAKWSGNTKLAIIKSMKVGDSFFVPAEYVKKRSNYQMYWAYFRRHGYKMAYRQVEGGIRIWRTK